MARSVQLTCATRNSPLVTVAMDIFTRILGERCGIATRTGGAPEAECRIEFAVQEGIGSEGFRIQDGLRNEIRIVGNDARGVLYGLGRLLRDSRYADGSFTPGSWRGQSVPEKPVRAMYFASHFHNFYHDAPVAAVERYVEELALWGCNALSVWYDMHHYTGTDDPKAQEMIARLHAVLKAANRVGMGASLCSLANEAYSTSPQGLRAEPFPHHYRVEICPSSGEGMDLILKWRREMIEAFADLEIEYFWIWPYDQGGCKCPKCHPWGSNGFVRNGEQIGRLVREMLPRAKTVVSTWEFGYWNGDAEWEGFYSAMTRRPDWVDYIMAEGHGDFPPYVLKHGAPGGFPLLNFPEISMSGMGPWGGFGANVQPQRLQKVWNSSAHLLSGGFPYSEGIYEDLNKAICFQLNWSSSRKVEDIVREYAAYEFSPDVAEDVTRAIMLMEEGQAHGLDEAFSRWYWGDRGKAVGFDLEKSKLYALPKVKSPERYFGPICAADAKLPVNVRGKWRWRILWLRAALDSELTASGGKATEKSDAYFDELAAVYHAEQAEGAVMPPGRRSLRAAVAGAKW